MSGPLLLTSFPASPSMTGSPPYDTYVSSHMTCSLFHDTHVSSSLLRLLRRAPFSLSLSSGQIILLSLTLVMAPPFDLQDRLLHPPFLSQSASDYCMLPPAFHL